MSSPITIDTIRQLALALPEVTEGVCFGTPAFYVGKKLLARLREDGETLAIKADYAEREFWMLAKPETFFLILRGLPNDADTARDGSAGRFAHIAVAGLAHDQER